MRILKARWHEFDILIKPGKSFEGDNDRLARAYTIHAHMYAFFARRTSIFSRYARRKFTSSTHKPSRRRSELKGAWFADNNRTINKKRASERTPEIMQLKDAWSCYTPRLHAISTALYHYSLSSCV